MITSLPHEVGVHSGGHDGDIFDVAQQSPAFRWLMRVVSLDVPQLFWTQSSCSCTVWGHSRDWGKSPRSVSEGDVF